MAKGAKKRRANRKKREMGLRVQTSCSGKDDFLPPEERGDDVFYPKTPVQASEGDEKDRISETEVGSNASQIGEPAFSQDLPSHSQSAENLGFREFDAFQVGDATGLERLESMLKEDGLESHESSRGFPMSSSEAMVKWEQLVKSMEFLGGLEALESSEGFPMSSSEAIIKWISLGKLECAIPDGHEALQIPEELNEHGNDGVLGYYEQDDDETWIRSKEEIVDGHEALRMPQEQNGCGRDTVLCCSLQHDVEIGIQSKEESVDGHGALHIPQEQNGFVNGTVLGCSLQPDAETGIQSKEETVDGHGTLHIPREQNGIERVALLGCSEQNYVETCMHCKEETVESVTNKSPFSSTLEEKLSWDVLTVFSDSEGNAVEAGGISKDETLEDVKNRGIEEGVRNGNPLSSTLGEKPSLGVLAVFHDSQLGSVEGSNISQDEIVEDVRNGESYFKQDYVDICIQCKEETVEDVKNRDPLEDVMNGNPSSTLREQPSLEMLAVFNDSELDVAEASDTPKGELVGDVKNRDSYFEQDYVETCTENKEEPVEDVKGRNPFSSIFEEKPSLEALAVFNDSKLNVVKASNVPKDEIVEEVKNNESYFEQDYTQTCIQCKEETVEDVNKGDHVEDVMNGNPSSTMGEQHPLEVLAVFNDSELDVAEAIDTPKGEIVEDVKNRDSYFEQDCVETCLQNKEEPVEDVKSRNPFSSVFGEKLSLEVLAVFNDSKLDVVEASNASKDEIVEDVKNNESCFEQDYTRTCIPCKEETVEGVRNGDPVEDVRNGNPFPYTLGEKPSLETLAAFTNFELDVVEASSISGDEIVHVAKNSEIYFEQGYSEACIQCKEGTLDDAKNIDHMEDVTTNGKTFSFALGGKPSLQVLAASNDSEHDVVEVSNISKDAIGEEVKTRESYFEQDYVKTCIQCKEDTVEDGKNRDSVEDVKNGNTSSSALGENPFLAVLAAFNNSKLDLAESTNISKDEIAEEVKNRESWSLKELVFAPVGNSELNAVEAGNGSRDEIVQDVLPVFDNSQPDVESCNQSKYEGVGDVKVADSVSSTMADKPALEVLVVPLPAAESSTERAEPLLANDFNPVDASAGIFQDAQTIQEEKPEEEIDMEFSNHLRHIHSAKNVEEDKSVRVKRLLTEDPCAGDKGTNVESTLHEDPNVEDDNHLSLPRQESPSLWKKFCKVLDCWLWLWN